MANAPYTARKNAVYEAVAALDGIFAPLTPSKKRRRREAPVSTDALMSLLPASKKYQLELARVINAASGDTADSDSRPSYRPSSLPDLLERLATFTLLWWNDSKPADCSAVDFARHGWSCTASKREEVSCSYCGGTWLVSHVKDWRSSEGQSAAQDLKRNILEKHDKSCPWRLKPCSSSLYRLPLSHPKRNLLDRLSQQATALQWCGTVQLQSPLSLQESEGLHQAVESHSSQMPAETDRTEARPAFEAVIIAVFGWATADQDHVPSEAGGSSRLIIRCSYCCRRIIVSHDSGQLAKPKTFNVETTHRRWCAYLTACPPEYSQAGWKALVAVLTGTSLLPQPMKIATRPEENETRTFQATLQKRFFDLINSGEKTWEGRCYRGQWRDVRIGDHLFFTQADRKENTLRKAVSNIRRFDGFRQMLETDNMLSLCLPGVETVDEGVDIYEGFPGYREAAQEHGCIMFEIRDISSERGTEQWVADQARTQFTDQTRGVVRYVRDLLSGVPAEQRESEG